VPDSAREGFFLEIGEICKPETPPLFSSSSSRWLYSQDSF